MIKINILSGPFVGQVRTPPKEITPDVILLGFSTQGWKYTIDYSNASLEEEAAWKPLEVHFRILTALKEGRGVIINGTTCLLEGRDIVEVATEIEKTISPAKKIVIKSDDESGMVIEAFELQ